MKQMVFLSYFGKINVALRGYSHFYLSRKTQKKIVKCLYKPILIKLSELEFNKNMQ